MELPVGGHKVHTFVGLHITTPGTGTWVLYVSQTGVRTKRGISSHTTCVKGRICLGSRIWSITITNQIELWAINILRARERTSKLVKLLKAIEEWWLTWVIVNKSVIKTWWTLAILTMCNGTIALFYPTPGRNTAGAEQYIAIKYQSNVRIRNIVGYHTNIIYSVIVRERQSTASYTWMRWQLHSPDELAKME